MHMADALLSPAVGGTMWTAHRRQLISLLQNFHHTRIITSHDLDMVLELCARTIVLHQGEVMADGPTLDIFRNEALLAACHLERPLSMQRYPVCAPGGPPSRSARQRPLVAPHGDTPHHHDRDHSH
jgi:ABC-type microcin C transport system duplicated ATPase subunit YejF